MSTDLHRSIARYRLEQLAPSMLSLAADLDALRPHLGEIPEGQRTGLRHACADLGRKLLDISDAMHPDQHPDTWGEAGLHDPEYPIKP